MTAETVAPSGLVTFMFTDVEGSTRLWSADTAAMSASLRVHDDVLRTTIERHNGYVFTTAGDSFCVAFADAAAAVSCARDTQAALADAVWPGPALRVRIGLHRGEADERDGDYFGPTLNTAGRVASAGHGGQVIMTDAVREAASAKGIDLGVHGLRDVSEPIHLHQIGDGTFPTLRVVPDMLSSLPIPATSLIGRDEMVRSIRALLLQHRLVTITGVGGSGKTRLAIEVAERELAHFTHGAYFADLSNVSRDEGVVAAVGDAIRLQVGGDDPVSQVLAYLADKQVLIVLDNCEHMIDACAEFAEAMLAHGGDWRVVATSREHLDVAGEHVVQAPSLAATDDGPAVELFADRAVSVEPSFVLDDTNRSTVAELCTRLDGMPLAIELAAARVVVMSPKEILDRIDDRFRILSGGRRRTRQRQSTLEATLDWSYELLEAHERRFLNTLGALVGPFDAALAASVADVAPEDALEVLASLVAKSLVVTRRDGDRTLFQMLETVRAYGLAHLRRDPGELEAARDRHLDHHLAAMAETVDDALAKFGSWAVWDWAMVGRWLALTPNLEAAIDWAIATDRYAEAGELLVGATAVWRELFTVQAILDRVDLVANALPEGSDVRERLLIPQVQLAMAVNDRSGVEAFLENAELAANETVREFRLVMAANSCSMTDPARSLELTEEGTSNGSDPFHFWDKNRADVHLFAGEYEQALALLRPHQGKNLWAVIDGTIAIALLMNGRPAEALRVAKDHPMNSSIRMSFGVIVGLCQLALGEHDAAERELISEARSAALGRMNLLSNSALVGLAALAHERGDVEWAKEIILGAGCQREVAINALARMVAGQIGVRDEFIDQQVAALTAADNDRTGFLRETLARFDAQRSLRP